MVPHRAKPKGRGREPSTQPHVQIALGLSCVASLKPQELFVVTSSRNAGSFAQGKALRVSGVFATSFSMLGRQTSVGKPQASPAHCSACGRQTLQALPRASGAPPAQQSTFRKGDATFKVRTESYWCLEAHEPIRAPLNPVCSIPRTRTQYSIIIQYTLRNAAFIDRFQTIISCLVQASTA